MLHYSPMVATKASFIASVELQFYYLLLTRASAFIKPCLLSNFGETKKLAANIIKTNCIHLIWL